MKALLISEYRMYSVDAKMDFWRGAINLLQDGLGDTTIGKRENNKPWVAEIIGTHPKYRLDRRFLKGQLDFRNANRKGNGVRMVFELESGRYYDCCTGKKRNRYFCKVTDDGDIETVTNEEVESWVKNTFPV